MNGYQNFTSKSFLISTLAETVHYPKGIPPQHRAKNLDLREERSGKYAGDVGGRGEGHAG